jgi:hypothetical protein
VKRTIRKCIRCRGTDLRNQKHALTRTVAGHTFKSSVPAIVCKSCGAVYFAGPALGDFDIAVAGKFMRKAVGLSAVALADLLDTSPETVSRWERGVSRMDRAAFAILTGIVLEKTDNRSETLDRLRALLRPARLGQLVQIDA